MSRAGKPIAEAYFATSALLRRCPQCRALPDDWCRDSSGGGR